ncbi:PEGA domain-containing protein, partial [Candidatus Poribacteria bacterium]|nr:PEGA domain-containing protein [Candidatus Poribacteria bacterium]
DKSSTVLVEKGKEKEVKFRLPQLKGSLSVSSDPPGAGVILDGEFKGNTPIIIYGLPIGQHSLKLLKSGHEDWQKQINIQDLKLTWQFVKLIRI